MHRGRSVCNHGAALAIVRHASLVTASNDWKLNTLETHEPLANVVVGCGIDDPPLSIAEELVQGVVSCALTDLVGIVVHVLCLVYCIINGSIGRVLWRGAVKTAGIIT